MNFVRSRWLVTAAPVALILLGLATTSRLVAGQGAPARRIRINPMIERLEQGKTVISPEDWTFIDFEHGLYIVEQLQARFAEYAAKRKPNGQIPTAPAVRLPMYGFEDPSWIVKQLLDTGAMTIIFPQVDTKDEALRAMRAMRYPPQQGSKAPLEPRGIRGFAPGRAVKFWNISQKEYLERADLWPLNPQGELFAMIMIESPTGVKNINDILDVPGIGAVFIGPSDLGMNYGVGTPKSGADKPLAPEEDEGIHTVLRACKAKKVVCGISATWAKKDLKQKLIDEGFRIIL